MVSLEAKLTNCQNTLVHLTTGTRNFAGTLHHSEKGSWYVETVEYALLTNTPYACNTPFDLNDVMFIKFPSPASPATISVRNIGKRSVID